MDDETRERLVDVGGELRDLAKQASDEGLIFVTWLLRNADSSVKDAKKWLDEQ